MYKYDRERLEKIKEEAFLLDPEERTETKRTLQEIIEGKTSLLRDIKSCLMLFYDGS